MKRSGGEDKRKWMEERAEAAEIAAENCRNKDLFDILKMISGEKKRQVAGVKGKDGDRPAGKATNVGRTL